MEPARPADMTPDRRRLWSGVLSFPPALYLFQEPVMSEPGVSVWGDTEELPREHKLEKDARADVCVVGAGIAGLTTAYLLARSGKRVAVLEANEKAASGETGFTTAHLTCVL